jgi:ABC-type transporter Mla subunit MlaD
MEMEITTIIKTIQQKATETKKNLDDKKPVQPQTLDELARAIKNLTETSNEVTQVDRSNIEKAIENLTNVETMIANIKKDSEKEMEGTAREELIAQITYMPVQEMIRDLRKFLKTGKKVEKSYKPRTN